MLRWLTALALSASILLTPAVSYGDTPLRAQEPVQLTPEVMTSHGREGIWLPLEQADRVFQALQQRERLQNLIGKQQILLGLQRQQIETSSRAMSQLDKVIFRQDLLIDDLKDVRASSLLAFSPPEPAGNNELWWGVGGVVVGIGITVGAVLLAVQVVRASGP